MPGHKSDYLEFGVKVSLDSKEAQNELKQLQQQLNSLGTLSNPKVGDKLSADMQKASQAAAQLKIALDSAIDVDTGKLDLSKFSRSLKDSGMSLKDYRNQLTSMGPEGEKAFTQVANSILKAEAPLRRTNKLIDTMWTTLKNTARWEFSSAILHGLESSLQKAVTYAQDLNKSLTDIRIVTGYSTDHMAEFAIEANKAAKALSATTTEYTNASLIYFQQGLSDQQVKERTEVTVKMANVTRDSAQTVSDQMTAVWNNFADGSHTLEYYADVMTALGAATASSTKEISDGLEKFAAVAETVGLSYEYAASALATITSNTRQSADVVGTALKTLFARIQGLSLGETLEDGTDLNKYSEALAKVGISIKESNGELKAMDDILNEMANVWETLNNDQQVALAQTVAGVRQYTQLVALMENWDNGDEDSMMANLQTSANATGALQEQADIYAESWEAARDRVTAALESIFNKLLKDEFFIDTLNSIEKIITGIDKFIDSIGGLQGVLTGLGAVATKVFSSQISSGLSNLAYNLNFKQAQKNDRDIRKDAANLAGNMLSDAENANPAQADAMHAIGELQVKMIDNSDKLSEKKQKLLNYEIEILKTIAAQNAEFDKQAFQNEKKVTKNFTSDLEKMNTYFQEGEGSSVKRMEKPNGAPKKQADYRQELEKAKKSDAEAGKNLQQELKTSIKTVETLKRKYKDLEKDQKDLTGVTKELELAQKKLNETTAKYKEAANLQNNEMQERVQDYTQQVNDEEEQKQREKSFSNYKQQVKEDIEAPEEEAVKWSDSLVGVADGVMSLTFGLTQLASAWDTISDPDATSWEKFQSIIMAMSMGLPQLLGGLKSLGTGLVGVTSALTVKSSALIKDTLATLTNKETTDEAAKTAIKKAIADGTATGATRLHAGAQAILNGHLAAGLLALWPYILALIALAAVVWGLVAAYNEWKKSTPEAQLKQAKKETEAAAQAAEDAKQAYDDLKSSISSYDSAIEALENLTEGTEEFTEALIKANEEARKLILLGNLTPNDYYIDENGAIQIKEEAKEKASKAAQDQYNNAVLSEASAKNNEIQKQQTVDADNTGLLQKAQYTTYVDKNGNERQFLTGYSSSEHNEKNLENAAKAINSTPGGSQAWLAKYDKMNVSGAKEEMMTQAVYGKDVHFVQLNDAQKEYIHTLMGSTNELISFADGLRENEMAMEANSKSAFAVAFANDENYQSTKNYTGFLNRAQEIFEADREKQIEDINKKVENNEIDLEAEMKKLGYIKGEEEGSWKFGEDGQEEVLTQERIVEIVAEAFARETAEQSGEEINESINATYDKLDNTDEQVVEGIRNGSLTGVENDAFLKGFSSMSAEEFIEKNGLGEEDFINLGFDSAEAFCAGWEELQSNYDYNDVIIQQLQDKRVAYEQEAAEVASIYDTLYSEGINALSEEQSAYLNGLEQKYSSLAQIGDRSSKEYAEALRIIEEVNESLAIGAMMAQEENLWDQYNEKVDEGKENTEEVKALLDEICALDYEIQLKINQDIESDLDNIYNKIDKVTSAAEKIGEGFKVSAKDIREVAKAFPGILEGYKVLADGQIQLNEKVAKAAIDAAHTEIKVDKKTALEKIKTQKQEVKTRLTVLKTILSIAEKKLKGEKLSIEEEGKLNDALADYKLILEQDALKAQADTLTEEEKNLDEFDVQNKESAEYSYNAFIEGSKAGADAETAFINHCIEALQKFVAAGQAAAALKFYNESVPEAADKALQPWTYSGEKGSSGNYSNSINGSGEGSQSFGDYLAGNGYTDNVTQESINALKQEISSYENLLNELTGQEAELLGSMAGLDNTLSNVGQGDGSGGSKEKEEELKDPKNYEDEIERYHENTRALEQLSRALDKVTTAKDRAFGKERLRLIEEEIAATEKLAAQQKSYLAEIEGYLVVDRTRLYGYGFTFDENGEITNYNEIYKQQVDKFNASRTEAAEEAYNKFVDRVEQYEETLTLLDEERIQYQEYLNSLVDLKLEKITTEVEVKVRVNDTELTRLAYMLKKLQREGASAADEIKNIADQINETMEKAGPIQEAIDKIYEQARAEGRGLTTEETAEMQSFYADGVIDAQEQERVDAIYAKANAENRVLTQAEEEQIQEYKEQLLQLNEEVWELADTIEGKLAEELDELDEEFDESLSRLTSYTQMYENLQNVLELTGKSKTAEGLNALNQLAASTLKNSTNALKANKANYDTFVELAAEANRHLQEAIEAGDKHMIDYWTEQVEDVTIRMEEAHIAMIESFNNALEAAGDLFDTKVKNMITKLKKDLGDLDTMVDLYKRASDLEKLYLSSNQSIYELSKLSRDIGKSIEDTSNLIAKNKLGDLMKEINRLRAEGVQLSKYDLEYWQAKYELELAEIALQEAQEAKSQVKLTRNSEGGWGYVYTADSDKIAEAEQNFEDKLYNMQKINEDYIGKYSEDLLKNRQEMLDALAKIDKTREDYDAEVLRVKEEYMAKEEFYVSELTKAYERQGIAYGDTILGMISNDESLLESHENFKDRTLEIIDEELIPAHEEWLENVKDICDEAGYSYDELTNGVLENMDSVNEASAELTEKTLQEQEDMRKSMKETMQEIKNWQLQYLETIDAMVSANEAYYKKTIDDYSVAMNKIVETASRALDLIVSKAQAAAAAIAQAAQMAAQQQSKDLVEQAPPPKKIPVDGNSKMIENGNTKEYYHQYVYKDGSVGEWVLTSTLTPEGDHYVKEVYDPYNAGHGNYSETTNQYGQRLSDDEINRINQSAATAAGLLLYDTGGYTGSWGEGWKLAGLHEKELVLNKHDTKNMLDMVNTLRDIDWRAKLNELWTNIEDQFINPVFGGAEELLQQVHIEANFPDLKDHFEIEEAFHNLINTASQYANRK